MLEVCLDVADEGLAVDRYEHAVMAAYEGSTLAKMGLLKGLTDALGFLDGFLARIRFLGRGLCRRGRGVPPRGWRSAARSRACAGGGAKPCSARPRGGSETA